MHNKLPYQEPLDDLPVPDEEASWQKMKQLLDSNDNAIPPPIFLRSCIGWGLLFLLLLAGNWFFIGKSEGGDEHITARQSENSQKEKEKQTPTNNSTNKQVEKKETAAFEKAQPNGNSNAKESSASIKEDITMQQEERKNQKTALIQQKDLKAEPSAKYKAAIARGKKGQNKETTIVRKTLKPGNQRLAKNKSADNKNSKIDTSNKIDDQNKNEKIITDRTINLSAATATNDSLVKQTAIAIDSSRKEATEPSKPAAEDSKKQKPQNKKKYYVSVGIGEQQQIPFNGQGAVPYNSDGRKGSLRDYIPSVYVRLHREQKWFVQAEFRYGAPQSVKDLSYSRTTTIDAFNTVNTTTLRLKKTYYHQIPLSLNYYVRPNWSVGIGGVYSRLYKAVAEREVRRGDVSSDSAIVSKTIIPIPGFTDSFLYKTQVHVLLQTDYQWKRFSVGLRYKKDIQPYIKYTKPNGDVNTEKNYSLEFILRYRLWQSKKI